MAIVPAAPGPISALAQRFVEVRQTTERICARLSAEDQMVQSMPEASPTKWHQAHTTWFFETFVLAPHLRGYKPFNPDFRFLFNSYYKQLAEDGVTAHPLRSLRGTFSRPSLREIQDYRQHVDEHVLRVLDQATPEVAVLVKLGTHHEQQHQELILTDIKHAFWTNPLRPPYSERHSPQGAQGAQGSAEEWTFLRFEGGVVRIGNAGDGFSFDNETPAHDVLLAPYRIASRLVTNGHYVEFMNDGGYRRPELWLSDGWDRVCLERWSAPLYWEQRDGEWHEFTLSGMRPIDPTVPVCHVSYYEAEAFARWAGARLPREEEWENAEKQLIVPRSSLSVGNLLDSGFMHPVPEDQRATRNEQRATLSGNVWQWTGSAYLPYPGFRPAAGAVGEYNGKFMSGQMVLRGGSCATPASHIRATYRNFFPPHARWQFMGIRLANDGD